MWWRATKAALWWRLTIAVLICVLPVAVLTAYLSQARRADGLHQAQRQAKVIAAFVVANLSGVIDETQRFVSSLAVELDRTVQEPADCSGHINRLRNFSDLYYQVVVTDSRGAVRCAATPMPNELNIGDRKYFQRAMTTGRFVMSDGLAGRGTGRWTVVGARPLRQSSGAIVAALNLQELSKRLVDGALPAGATVRVIDGETNILARIPDGKGLKGEYVFPAPGSIRTLEGITTATNRDHVVAYARVANVPYSVQVTLPLSGIEGGMSRVVQSGLLTLISVLALALSVAWFAADRLVARPLRDIMRGAQRLYEDDAIISTGISHNDPIIGPLATALDALAGKRARVGRALKTLSGGNRTLLREHDELSLLQQMCKVAVEKGGYPLAFVAYGQDDADRTVKVVAQFGRSEGFVDQISITWGKDERGQGTVGTAIRTGMHCIFRSIAKEPRFVPWRDEALRRNFRSIISLPLSVGGTTIGTFTLLATEEDAFDVAEVELLDEMAADLSFGIAGIRSAGKRREAEVLAEYAQTHDQLTGLPNRTVFARRVEATLQRLATEKTAAVAAVHLSKLQDIFDGFGYAIGDNVVKEVARRLHGAKPHDAEIARISFSDFAMLIDGSRNGTVAQTAHAMFDTISRPITVAGVDIAVHGAVGVSFYPADGQNAELLIRRAAIAAREGSARHVGYFKYRGGIERENPAALALAADLITAIERDGLALHFQPRFDLRTDKICGREALIRWSHASRGAVSPSQFIPVAERSGLIRRITQFVISTAIERQAQWLEEGGSVPLALNLSARDLHDKRLVYLIEQSLEQFNVPPHLIQCEITETAFIGDRQLAKQALERLRKIGIHTYIDDFGTGYCALNYLSTLPVSGLKIDKSFVKQMVENERDNAIVATIITMAHSLNLRVIAEGVETMEQLCALKRLDCDEGQGYLLGMPSENG